MKRMSPSLCERDPRRALCTATLLLFALACAAGREESLASLAASAGPDAACVDCHLDAASDLHRTRHHAGLNGGLGCLTCHTPHREGGGRGPSELRASCASCHADVLAEFNLPFAHPLDRFVTCTSCHPAHGGSRQAVQHQTRLDRCTECHLEFAGPFIYPHEGSARMGCISCHEPHGSGNRRLLTHADQRSLCFSCHENLELLHVQNPGSVFRECLSCHTEIHGSNWDRDLYR